MGDLFANKHKDTALNYYHKSISIFEELYGQENAQVIIIYNNIAAAYMLS